MIQWEYMGYLLPSPDWQIFDYLLGDDEAFLISIGYRIKPFGTILIAQAYDFPYLFYGIQSLYPEKDRFLVNFPIPPQIKAQASYERRLATKFISRSFNENDQLTISLFKISPSTESP